MTAQYDHEDQKVKQGIMYGKLSICTVLYFQAIRQLQYSYFKKSLLGAVSDDGCVNLWDCNTRQLVHSFKDIHKAPAMGLAFSPLNEMLLTSVGLDKRIVCYDVQGNSLVFQTSFGLLLFFNKCLIEPFKIKITS